MNTRNTLIKTAKGDHPRVVIDEVRFDVPIHLAQSAVDEAIAEANEIGMDATDPGWVNEFVEAGIRSAWQNRGYFRVTVGQANAEPVGGDSQEQHFRVTIPINEGLQYHLGYLTFTNAKGLSAAELRGLISLQEGEFFDISKIRAGIEALTKEYAAIGYIDFTAVPETEFDDKLQRISLTLELDEQEQYHIQNVSVIGLDPALEQVLRSQFVPGDVFNPTRISDFVKQNRSVFPGYVSERDYLQTTKNTRLGTVDLSFDFGARPCNDQTP